MKKKKQIMKASKTNNNATQLKQIQTEMKQQ